MKIAEKLLLYQIETKQDPESYGKLYDLYVQRIYRFIYFKVSNREEAEDITSEVFLKAWNHIQEKKEVKSFSGLLYRIARNCVIDLYRSRSSHPEFLSDEGVDAGDRGKWQLDIKIRVDNQKIIQALKKMKQEYREIITLRYVDELEINEIAEITNKGKIAVRVTLHRALKKLKEILGG